MPVTSHDVRPARALGLANLALGAVMVVRARSVASVGREDGRPDPRIVRVLGLRQCAQGAVTIAVPNQDVLWLGAATDLLHAASMVPFGLTRFRRAALISATLATASAIAGLTIRGTD